MKKRLINQMAMAAVLAALAKERQAELAVSKVADQEAQDMVTAYELVAPRLSGAQRQTKQVTKRRAGVRKAFVELLVAVLGPARLLAAKQNDTDLLAVVTVGKSQLTRLRPQPLVALGRKLVDTSEGLATELTDYGVDAAMLTALRAAFEAFEASVPETRIVINARTVDNLTAQELVKALMQQIYELDAAMAVFSVRNKDLFAAYQQARKIVDVGARPEADAAA